MKLLTVLRTVLEFGIVYTVPRVPGTTSSTKNPNDRSASPTVVGDWRKIALTAMLKVTKVDVHSSIVILDYTDLVNNSNLSDEISAAFGGDGLGILCVRNIPGYIDARATLLPLAQKFSTLCEAIKVFYFCAISVSISLLYENIVFDLVDCSISQILYIVRRNMYITIVAILSDGPTARRSCKVDPTYRRALTMPIHNTIGANVNVKSYRSPQFHFV